jgi:hypothetical protein
MNPDRWWQQHLIPLKQTLILTDMFARLPITMVGGLTASGSVASDESGKPQRFCAAYTKTYLKALDCSPTIEVQPFDSVAAGINRSAACGSDQPL